MIVRRHFLVKQINLLLLLIFIVIPTAAQVSVTTAKSVDASDYPSLQAAINAIPESGGIVRIPPGDFELQEPLLISTENTRIQGSGSVTHLINKNEDGKPAIIVRLEKENQFRVELSNFRVSGNSRSGDGIFMENVQELLITELTVDHNGQHGINMKNCYENPRIALCNFTYNGKAGINIDGGHDIIVSANQFEENQDALRIKDGFNLTMTGNNIDDHLRHGIVVENTYGSVISGNMIEECQGTAIILTATDEKRFCYGITISSNLIAHHLGGGVELNNAWGCTVSANTFTLVHNFSVKVDQGSQGITITGNNFSHSRGKLANPREDVPFTWDVGSGIVLGESSDISVTGNLFGGLTNEAIKAGPASSRILFMSNTIGDMNFPNGSKKAIDLGEARNSTIKNNIIKR